MWKNESCESIRISLGLRAYCDTADVVEIEHQDGPDNDKIKLTDKARFYEIVCFGGFFTISILKLGFPENNALFKPNLVITLIIEVINGQFMACS